VSGSGERRGPTDASLVRRAQDGDVAAFDLLARRHGDRAYRVALRLLNNTHDAEDATQEALVSAWRALHRFRADSAFSTWLYRIVTNTALNHATRQRQLTVPLEQDQPAGEGQRPEVAVSRPGGTPRSTGRSPRCQQSCGSRWCGTSSRGSAMSRSLGCWTCRYRR